MPTRQKLKRQIPVQLVVASSVQKYLFRLVTFFLFFFLEGLKLFLALLALILFRSSSSPGQVTSWSRSSKNTGTSSTWVRHQHKKPSEVSRSQWLFHCTQWNSVCLVSTSTVFASFHCCLWKMFVVAAGHSPTSLLFLSFCWTPAWSATFMSLVLVMLKKCKASTGVFVFVFFLSPKLISALLLRVGWISEKKVTFIIDLLVYW